jgi:hypothetical protein
MKVTSWGRGKTFPLIFKLRFTARPLYSWGKISRYSLSGRMEGQAGPRAGLDVTEKRKFSFPLPKIKPQFLTTDKKFLKYILDKSVILFPR